MLKASKFALATLVAALALAVAVGSAAALRSLSLSPAGAITLTARNFEERIREAFGTNFTIQSEVTLSGELNRAIAKTANATVGSINRAAIANCRMAAPPRWRCARKSFLTATAWPITYNSISGTLPNITSVLWTIGRMQSQWTIQNPLLVEITCLYRGDIGVDSNGPPINSLTIQPGFRILSLFAGEMECFSAEEVEPGFTIARQTVTLI